MRVCGSSHNRQYRISAGLNVSFPSPHSRGQSRKLINLSKSLNQKLFQLLYYCIQWDSHIKKVNSKNQIKSNLLYFFSCCNVGFFGNLSKSNSIVPLQNQKCEIRLKCLLSSPKKSQENRLALSLMYPLPMGQT